MSGIEPKYCKDCRYFWEPIKGGVAMCSRYVERTARVDLVRGPSTYENHAFCENERKESGKCGIEARGWAKREEPPRMLGQRDDSIFARVFGPWHSF